MPIFLALIAADVEGIYHANHGQLGFALKDQRTPNWHEAEGELTKAIEIRDKKLGEGGWLSYEFSRALCRINQDAGFNTEKPSDDAAKEKILTDLKAAAKEDSLANLIDVTEPPGNPDIVKWLSYNKEIGLATIKRA